MEIFSNKNNLANALMKLNVYLLIKTVPVDLDFLHDAYALCKNSRFNEYSSSK